MNRVVTYGAAVSLDGFIAGPDHEVDWLTWSEDVAEITAAYWRTVDTVVMGRSTYLAAQRAGTTAYPNVANYVCSTTLRSPPSPAVTLVTDAVGLIRRLTSESGGEICVMGGGVLARALLEANLIDRIGVNIQPILLGGGIPFLPAAFPPRSWEILETRTLTAGSVYALYQRRPSTYHSSN